MAKRWTSLSRYFSEDEPFEHIGSRKREVRNLMVTKGDIPGLWTVLWEEVYVHGSHPPERRQQSVSFCGGAAQGHRRDGQRPELTFLAYV